MGLTSSSVSKSTQAISTAANVHNHKPWGPNYNIAVLGSQDAGKSALCSQLFLHPSEVIKTVTSSNHLSTKLTDNMTFFLFGFMLVFISHAKIDPRAIISPGYYCAWDTLPALFEKVLRNTWGQSCLDGILSLIRFNNTSFEPKHQPQDHHWEVLKCLWKSPQVQKMWLNRQELQKDMGFVCNYFHLWMNFVKEIASGTVDLELNLNSYYTFADHTDIKLKNPRIFGVNELWSYIKAWNYQKENIDDSTTSQAFSRNKTALTNTFSNSQTTPEYYRHLYYQSTYYLMGDGEELPSHTTSPLFEDMNVEVFIASGRTHHRMQNLNTAPQTVHKALYVINLSHTTTDQLDNSHTQFSAWSHRLNNQCTQTINLGGDDHDPPQWVTDFNTNGCIITLVCTHDDILLEQIKTGLVRMSEQHGAAFTGRDGSYEDAKEFIIQSYYLAFQKVFAAGRLKLAPEPICVNGLDRDDVLEKLGPYFANMHDCY